MKRLLFSLVISVIAVGTSYGESSVPQRETVSGTQAILSDDSKKVEENFATARRRYQDIMETRLDADRSIISSRVEFLQKKEKELAAQLEEKQKLLKELPWKVEGYYQLLKEEYKGVNRSQFEEAARSLYQRYEEMKNQIAEDIVSTQKELTEVGGRLSQLEPQLDLVMIKQDLREKDSLFNPVDGTPVTDLETKKRKDAVDNLERLSQRVIESKLARLDEVSPRSLCTQEHPCGRQDCFRCRLLGLTGEGGR